MAGRRSSPATSGCCAPGSATRAISGTWTGATRLAGRVAALERDHLSRQARQPGRPRPSAAAPGAAHRAAGRRRRGAGGARRAARQGRPVTGMVGEFPELQGVMGGYYARHDGEDPARRRRRPRPLRPARPRRPGADRAGQHRRRPGRQDRPARRLLRRGRGPDRLRRPLRAPPRRARRHPDRPRERAAARRCSSCSTRPRSTSRPRCRRRRCWSSSPTGCACSSAPRASGTTCWPRCSRPAPTTTSSACWRAPRRWPRSSPRRMAPTCSPASRRAANILRIEDKKDGPHRGAIDADLLRRAGGAGARRRARRTPRRRCGTCSAHEKFAAAMARTGATPPCSGRILRPGDGQRGGTRRCAKIASVCLPVSAPPWTAPPTSPESKAERTAMTANGCIASAPATTRAARTCATCSAARAPTWPRWPASACPCRPASPSRPRSAPRSTRTTGNYPDGLEEQVRAALRRVEAAVGLKFGDAEKPLLVSVRSGARVSMPGMMDTVLNLGLNDDTVAGLAEGQRRPALRLGQLSPLHPDVRLGRARGRAPPVRGDHRKRQAGRRRAPRTPR